MLFESVLYSNLGAPVALAVNTSTLPVLPRAVRLFAKKPRQASRRMMGAKGSAAYRGVALSPTCRVLRPQFVLLSSLHS